MGLFRNKTRPDFTKNQAIKEHIILQKASKPPKEEWERFYYGLLKEQCDNFEEFMGSDKPIEWLSDDKKYQENQLLIKIMEEYKDILYGTR